MTTTHETNLGSQLALEANNGHNHFVAVGEYIYFVLPDRVVALHDRDDLEIALQEHEYLDPDEDLSDDMYDGFRLDAGEVCDYIEDLAPSCEQLDKARQSDDDAEDVLRSLFNMESN